MASSCFVLDPSYGKQSVPVFKVIKQPDGRHDIIDMVVQIMLEGDVSLSWTKGDNRQIVPTETQKNTCYALALQLDFNSPEEYAIGLANDILSRHGHIRTVTLDVTSRRWERVKTGGAPHKHCFASSPAPPRSTCHVVVARDGGPPRVRSGVDSLRIMKTTQSGFEGFIRDKYTDLQPVGKESKSPDRIMCTQMTATWDFRPGSSVVNYTALNHDVLELLIAEFTGPARTGVFSKSLQETVYVMATRVLERFPMIDEIDIVTPNVHFYTWPGDRFGLDNPNVVFQSTDPAYTASGRIRTRVLRRASKL